MEKWFCLWNDLANPKNGLNLVPNPLQYQNVTGQLKKSISVKITFLKTFSCAENRNTKLEMQNLKSEPKYWSFQTESEKQNLKNKLEFRNFYTESEKRKLKIGVLNQIAKTET